MPARFGVASGPGGVTPGQSRFSVIPSANIQRSRFNRSCNVRTTLNAGDLVPVFVDEVLPGDTFRLRPTMFGRFATLLHPVMENLHLDFFAFFCPNRLVWDNWQKMCGEQIDPGDSTDYQVPVLNSGTSGGYAVGSIFDQMGIPPLVEDLEHSALPFRMMNLIWNEWFRDQNLQDSVTINRGNGPDPVGDYTILKRGKRHDYFTSCLPFPQKGPDVVLPLGLTAPVTGDVSPVTPTASNFPRFKFTDDASGKSLDVVEGATSVNISSTFSGTGTGAFPAQWERTGLQIGAGAVADLSTATAATISQLREAITIQHMFERDARGGTRYTEILRSHFGVISPDARLQRPEFLSGGSMRINVNPVAQTAPTFGGADAVGDLGAFVTFSGQPNGFNKSFVEHGFVICFVSIRADLNYQQGLERFWSRRRRFDYYWPDFAHLSEQAVLNREIYAQGAGVAGTVEPTADEEVFGYQERFAEYRYKPSQVRSIMRSVAAQSLDTWHLAQDFASLPVLNDEFIVEDPPIDRIVAVLDDAPQFLLDAWFELDCVRPMPVYSVPGLNRF